MPQAKLVAFDRRLNPQSRFSLPGLPKTTQLVSRSEFEIQIKKLAKEASLPVDRALEISFKHPNEYAPKDVDSALFHKQIWDQLHEQREQQKDSLLAEIEAKKNKSTKTFTLGELADRYFETIDSEVTAKRIIQAKATVNSFLKTYGSDTLVTDFDGDLTTWRNKVKKTLKKNTLVFRIAILKAWTRHYSVAKFFKKTDFNWGCCKRENVDKQPFSNDELNRILEVAKANKNKNLERFYYFALYAGFRCGEIVQIELKHLHLDGDDIKPEPYILIPKQKSKKVNQRYPLLPQLVEFLKEDLAKRNSREKYYLDTGFGTRIWNNASSITQAVRTILLRPIGIDDKSAHTFRHTFCNKLLLQTRDVYLVSKAMRHSCVQVTEEYLSDEIQELGIAERLTKITF